MTSVILLAGGSWTRFWADKSKALLAWKPIFLYSLETFHTHPKITEIIIIARTTEIPEYEKLKKQFPKIRSIIAGGDERQESVKNGIQDVTQNITLIHNGANPLVTKEEITNIIEATKKYGAAVVGSKSINTLKMVNEKNQIIKTIPRKNIYEVQTPQGVTTKRFKNLIQNTNTELFTDDVSFFEHAKLPVQIIPCSPNNFKITYPTDLIKMESILNQKIKIGIGHDSHRITKNKNYITLWGIDIKCGFGLEWNSDADVLVHTICNAIGTAIWQGSLSKYSDEMCKNWITDSKIYLKHIFSEVKKLWYQIGNIACSIEAKKPKLETHIPAMKEAISNILECTTLQIGIACTSGEELSDFWKWLGIQCFAHVMLVKK